MTESNNFRKEYEKEKMFESDLSGNPFKQFDNWFAEVADKGIQEPNVMVLSTVSDTCRPSSRIVLLKELSDKGFSFFTNYQSKKGKHINKNPFGSLLFPWHTIERQIRIEGVIEKISEAESDAYYNSRPAGSRIGAWASPQSTEIPSRKYLEDLESKFKQKFQHGNIPRPSNWGGYRLIPDLFEFWQGRDHRLHDRIEYKLIEKSWIIRRLAP